MTDYPSSRARLGALVAVCMLMISLHARAQNRGVYPLGMSATNSGVTAGAGFTYANQLLFYSRDHAKDAVGNTVEVKGQNYVLMDMNTLAWVSSRKILGAAFSASATLPFARNSLTTEVAGSVSGGAGFAASYYLPFILGWKRDRVAVRPMYGFLAPTGRFAPTAN